MPDVCAPMRITTGGASSRYSPATSRRRKITKEAASGTAMKSAETQSARMIGVQSVGRLEETVPAVELVGEQVVPEEIEGDEADERLQHERVDERADDRRGAVARDDESKTPNAATAISGIRKTRERGEAEQPGRCGPRRACPRGR